LLDRNFRTPLGDLDALGLDNLLKNGTHKARRGQQKRGASWPIAVSANEPIGRSA
jgi:hypothetical protein